MSDIPPLAHGKLRRFTDPDRFTFETTAQLDEVPGIIGQERVEEAVRFSIGVRRYGYNLFALGPVGMGKHSFVRAFLEREAADSPEPNDWCYVHNFKDPRRPRALELPPERAPRLREQMESLVEGLQVAIPAVFEGDDYRNRRQMLEAELNKAGEKAFAAVEAEAQEQGFSLIRSAQGVGLAPMADGKVMDPEDFAKLPAEDQERIKARMQGLQKKIEQAAGALPNAARQHRDELRKLERQIVRHAASDLVDEVRVHWTDVPEVLTYLSHVEGDVVQNAADFLPRSEGANPLQALLGRRGPEKQPFKKYVVNVLVTHDEPRAPVIFEDHPTYANLVGRIEHLSELGSLVTDFTLIQPGALHRANGGYLIIEVRKLLQQPMAWDELKRSLRSQTVRVDSLTRAMSLVTTASLEPEPIPLDLKVVLVGERQLYYALSAMDPDFGELFKVAADFDELVDRSPEGEDLYARLLGTFARRESLRALDRGGVARAVEHASRRAGDSEKLHVHAETLADLLREADHLASEAGAEIVSAVHVQAAIDAGIRRASRIRERIQEDIRRGTVLIDTKGETVGQVNGLSVLQLGGYAFGRPNRITARARLGNGSVVDIEKEVALGGPLHSKGVLILSGFLGQRFASERPLSLAASLVFEQSYSGVDGDSASCAELVALLSALSSAPVKQGRAITGSVNQHGQVQPIGGVNEKIEGFFDVCQASGLTGEEGVLIPASNVKHLMLRADIVEAAEKGLFHVWPIETVDQAVELLTGQAAGERGEDGAFPEGSINRRADDRLDEFAKKARAFGKPAPQNANSKNGKTEKKDEGEPKA